VAKELKSGIVVAVCDRCAKLAETLPVSYYGKPLCLPCIRRKNLSLEAIVALVKFAAIRAGAAERRYLQ
jgi:hypothetical protein